MKKVLLFALVLLIGIAFVSTGFAQETKAPDKPKPAPEKKAPEKAAPAKEKSAATDEKPAAKPAKEKSKVKPGAGFTGIVAATDSVYNTVTVQRGKDIVTFDLNGATFKGYKNADQITVGDKIAMKYDKNGALSITKVAEAKKAAPAAKKKKVAKPKKEKKQADDKAKPADEQKPAKKDKKVKKDEKKEEKPEKPAEAK